MSSLGEYNPKEIEEKWATLWTEKNLYHVEDVNVKNKFSLVIPPPNVTGSLHMGHALNVTLQDIIARWQRMKGKKVVWVPGFDHAGIATQYVVEKQLTEKGLSRRKMGRQEFLKRIWEWVPISRDTIRTQLKRLGVSVDWERERFTLDEGFSRAVRRAFRELYERNLIYRSEYIVNWCPRDLTALSDLEVEHEEEKGKLWYIKYPLEDGSGYITVATTRPETMLGDTAVAVNPEDERYKNFVGKRVKLPLVSWKRKTLKGEEIEVLIPIIADKRVKREFGTGAVKVTPAHDPNDFEIGKEHNLSFVRVMDFNGVMNENAGDLRGLDRYEARREIVKRLKEEGYLEKEEEHLHTVGKCYRCKTVIEPMVSVQWFVKVSAPEIRDNSVKVVENIYVPVEREVKINRIEAKNIYLRIVSENKVLLLEDVKFFINLQEENTLTVCHNEDFTELPENLIDRFSREYSVPAFAAGFEGELYLLEEGRKETVAQGRFVLLYNKEQLKLQSWEGKTISVIGKGIFFPEPHWRLERSRTESKKIIKNEKNGIEFIPSQWKKFYLEWMKNLKDWCISRQIWWGHRIPVWYCKKCDNINVYTDDDFSHFHDKIIFNLLADGKIKEEFAPKEIENILKSPNFVHPNLTVLEFYKKFVFNKYYSADLSAESLNFILAAEKLHSSEENLYKYNPETGKWKIALRCKKCGSEDLQQEEDVLDTWFSSALWPFAVFGWPEETQDLKDLYPTDLLITGFDIVFFWVARMIMMGTALAKKIPFKDVYVHALIRDEKGQKMSKTKGNVIDPLDIAEKYGADALRFTLSILTVQGRDIKLSEKRFEGYKHFANKIWNAARFILMNTPDNLLSQLPYIRELYPEDLWIISRLNEVADQMNRALNDYEFSKASHLIYDFLWSDFCDWYIEFAKDRIYKSDKHKESAVYTLNYVFEKALRLLHPFMPFITEELWHKLPLSDGESISLKEYPSKKEEEIFSQESKKVERLKEIISAVRSLRSDLQIEPSKKLRAFFKTEGELSANVIREFKHHILNLARLESFEPAEERPSNTVATFSGDTEIFLSVEKHLDINRLLESFEKKKKRVVSDLEKIRKKLSNKDFMKKAPPHVVEREKRIKEELESDLEKINRILTAIKELN